MTIGKQVITLHIHLSQSLKIITFINKAPPNLTTTVYIGQWLIVLTNTKAYLQTMSLVIDIYQWVWNYRKC